MLTVGVYGATGQVGGVMRAVLDGRRFPHDRLRLFASARSAGRDARRRGRWRTWPPPIIAASTWPCSPWAPRLLANSGKRWPPRAPSSSTTPRPGAWTPTARSWCRRSTPPRWVASRRGSWPIPTARPWCACRCWPRCTPRPGWSAWWPRPTRRSPAPVWPARPSWRTQMRAVADKAAALAVRRRCPGVPAGVGVPGTDRLQRPAPRRHLRG